MAFNYDMNARGRLSLREHLYRCIRDDIVEGTVAAGDRLPSKRELARRLGVSLITVESAYAQLVAEGYVLARQRSGYFAVTLPQLSSMFAPRQAGASSFDSAASHALSASASVAQTAGTPEVSRVGTQAAAPAQASRVGAQAPAPLIADFSRPTTPDNSPAAALWSRALRNALVQEPRSCLFGPQPSAGTLRLREAIVAYLAQTRGMAIDPERVVVGAGAQLLYMLVAQLFGSAHTVAVEDPGYPQLADVYERCGLCVRHLPLDAEGVDMNALRESDAQVVHIMPSHQFPTGRVTSIARRYELLSWAAQESGRYIVEDDYDRAFRFAGMPIPPLQSIDAPGRVIYMSTFSKSLSSALRMAYMVLPESLATPFKERLGFYANTVSVVDQVTLARLMESGEYGRHLNRYRKRQRDVRDALLRALRDGGLGSIAHAEEADSGLHFVLALDTRRSEEEIARRAREAGVLLAPLSSYAHNAENAYAGDGLRRFVMQYEGLDTALIPPVIKALAWAAAGTDKRQTGLS